MLRVLITGLPGFAARYATSFALQQGWFVFGVSRRGFDAPYNWENSSRYRQLFFDLRSIQQIPNNLDAIIHMAATLPFKGSTTDKIVSDNYCSTQNLVHLALKANARAIVFFSSTSVFGREHEGIVDDSTPSLSPEPYGMAKRLCEHLLQDAAKQIPSIALRLPGIIGPGAGNNWVATVCDRILTEAPIAIYNPKALFNSCVHIADVMELIKRLVERGLTGFEAAILASQPPIQIEEVLHVLQRALGRVATVTFEAPLRTPFTLDDGRAKLLWSWEPMSLPAALSKFAVEQLEFRANVAGLQSVR